MKHSSRSSVVEGTIRLLPAVILTELVLSVVEKINDDIDV
jgi:hypothetical protein